MPSIVETIAPKSDQKNYDDFLGGQTLTIKITGVSIVVGDQPVTINYEGDNGKPYKPSKGMRRVLVNAWGTDANKYIGRSLTLYGDEKVMFGGAAVGGIRISHMSHIDKPITMALTVTRANKKPFVVKPLVVETAKQAVQPPEPMIDKTIANDLLALITDANIAPDEFKKHFGISIFMGLPVSKLAEAKQWITDNKKEQA